MSKGLMVRMGVYVCVGGLGSEAMSGGEDAKASSGPPRKECP